MPSRRAVAPALAAVLLAAACGTTVPEDERTALGGADGLGGGTATGSSTTGGLATSGTTGTVAGATTGGPGTSGTSGSTPGTSGSTTGFGSTTGVTSGTTTGGRVNGPGTTDKVVYVGLIHDRSAGALNQAAGASGLTSGDSKADEKAVIDDINAHGGVGGRRLVPVYAELDSTSPQTVDQQYVAVCDTFVRDQRVFVASGPGPESYLACMQKAGIPVIDDDLPSLGAEGFRKYTGFIEQGYANVDRLAAYHVAPLVAQRYFTPWNSSTGQPAPAGTVKVGVLTLDDKVYSGAVDRLLTPALRKLGYDPVVVKVVDTQSASEISSQAAAVQSAQLTFATRGVTHVLIFEQKAALSQFFMANARSQNYYPRYGFNSSNGPQALLTAGLLTAKQANGAVGYGWLPNLDLLPEHNRDNGPYSNPMRRKCAAVMRGAGISFDSSNAQGIGFIACSTLYLVKAAVDRTPDRLTGDSFLAAVAGLGASFQPAGGLGPRSQAFAPGRNDPQDRAYHMSFSNACGCFRYTGAIQTIP